VRKRGHGSGPDDLTTTGKQPRGVGSIDSKLDRTWSAPPEDLARDTTLRGCARTQFAGAPRPTLGDYPLLARIGQGGMGVVYFGVHPRLETEVAVKILPEEIHARQPDLLRRFVREARLAARLNSDYLVRVLDVDRDKTSGLYYLVMEYVRGVAGGKWAELCTPGGHPGVAEDMALDVCIAATRGLAAAHERGTIHRDVKPDNILIPGSENGYLVTLAKLADLGLACLDEPAGEAPRDSRLTGTRMTLMGTPGYAAPEQLKDPTRAKKPADVFSMGATLYAFLTKNGPFSRGAPMESVLATMKGEFDPIRTARPDLSASTTALIDVCLAPEPEKRYPDAFALLEALRLCRQAYGRTDSPTAEVTTDVVRLAQRSEVGESVHTNASGSGRSTTGRLRLEGGPPSAQVSLRRRGAEPLTYAALLDSEGRFERDHVEEGVYDVTASRAGFHPYSSTIEVSASGANVGRIAMRERDGIVSVDSDPPGAEVAVDGTPVGITPMPGLAVMPGNRTITVSLAGHDRVSRTIVVRGGATTQLGVLKLEPLGRLDLASMPDDVHFELDGKAVRSGQEMKPGAYRLRASRDGYEPQEVELYVTARAAAAPLLGTWRRQGWALVSDLERWDATTAADRRRVARTIVEKLPDFELRAMETFESGGARHEVAILVHRPTGIEFVLVPGGRFEMGSPAGEPGRRSDERRHRSAVPPFLMARTAVPQAAWEGVMRTNPSHFRGPSLPVEHVSHVEATRFCSLTGLALPSESQWEYACRAGSPAAWCFGDDAAELAEHAWFGGTAGPRPVGGRRPNAFGLLDLHGNVWEWCADRYREYPLDSDDAEPELQTTATGTEYRVFRGGGWADPPERLRSAHRSAFRPDHKFFDLGFRPVRALTPDLVAERVPSGPAAPTQEIAAATKPAESAVTAAVERTTPIPRAASGALLLLQDVTRWDAADAAERRRAAEETAARERDFTLLSMSQFEAGGVRHEIGVFLHRPTEMEFVLLPGGAITLSGMPGHVQRRRPDDAAAQQVQPSLFARTPVTQAAWKRANGANPSCFSGDRLPVEQVDLAGADAFCRRYGLVLPTEAQWEFACRAGTDAQWCCGKESRLPEFAWFEKNAGTSTHPVGEKLPNAFGLLDIIGNVWEWCRLDEGTAAREPRCRGGAWTSDARQLQSSWRLSYPAGTRMGILGFRPLRELSSPLEVPR
jgi:formylglycine-generating enzyme required for sulfatase activity/serine/threonine protein kinase